MSSMLRDEGRRSEADPGGVSGPGGNRLLILDDNSEFALQVSELAQRSGFVVKIASSIAGFKATLEAFDPSILVLDIVLGDVDICPVLDDLVARQCVIPIILVSGYDQRVRDSVANVGRGLLIADVLSKHEGFERLAAQLNAYKSV